MKIPFSLQVFTSTSAAIGRLSDIDYHQQIIPCSVPQIFFSSAAHGSETQRAFTASSMPAPIPLHSPTRFTQSSPTTVRSVVSAILRPPKQTVMQTDVHSISQVGKLLVPETGCVRSQKPPPTAPFPVITTPKRLCLSCATVEQRGRSHPSASMSLP